jgi:TRAP-type C4-dicarboxylate transport system permease small subunit
MRRVARLLDRFIVDSSKVFAMIGVGLIVLMVVTILVNVMLRRLFSVSLAFVDEYAGYALVVIVFLGFAYTAMVGGHIRITLVTERLPKRMRDAVEVATLLLCLALVGLLSWFAWHLFVQSLHSGVVSIQTRTPLWVPQVVMWLGSIFFTLAIARLIVLKLVDFQRRVKEEAGEEPLAVADDQSPLKD